MWKCPKCGAEMEGALQGYSKGTATATAANDQRSFFFCCWSRGWLVLLMIACSQTNRSYVE
jgi:hypothetical protein